MAIGIIPAYLLFKDKWDEVVILLQSLPIPPRRKKEIIVEWCNYVGTVLTRDMIEEVLGLDAEGV